VLRGIGIYDGIIANPQSNLDVCRIDSLPIGKYLIEISFSVTFANWSNQNGLINYSVFLGSGKVPNSSGGHYVTAGQQNGATNPVPIFERFIVDVSVSSSLFIRFSSASSQPSFRNVILTATKL
jgi:hypothetical protein